MAFETRALKGKMLGQRYLVGELQMETDVSTLFRGEDTRTGCAVSVHVVRDGLGPASNAWQTLELEASSACAIRHPNVVTPHDIGVLDDGSPYLVTARFGGETLEDRVCLSGGLPVGDVVRIGLDLLSALSAAHDVEIVHGDLRPQSIFLVERDDLILQTLVSGFGRRACPDSRGHGFADLAFVAPEIAAGAACTPASDIYAVGAILYLAATGFPPYSAPSASELEEEVRHGTLRTPKALRPELPARLVRVLMQALQTDPTQRFGSASEMLAALDIARGAFGAAYRKLPADASEQTTMLPPPPDGRQTFGAFYATCDEETRSMALEDLGALAVQRWSKSGVVPAMAGERGELPSTDELARDFTTPKSASVG